MLHPQAHRFQQNIFIRHRQWLVAQAEPLHEIQLGFIMALPGHVRRSIGKALLILVWPRRKHPGTSARPGIQTGAICIIEIGFERKRRALMKENGEKPRGASLLKGDGFNCSKSAGKDRFHFHCIQPFLHLGHHDLSPRRQSIRQRDKHLLRLAHFADKKPNLRRDQEWRRRKNQEINQNIRVVPKEIGNIHSSRIDSPALM